MSSEYVCSLFLTGCIWVAATASAGGGTPAEAFVAAQFTNPPAPSALVLTGQVAKVAQDILGQPYTKREVLYWQGEGKTLWILETRGRSGLITAGFILRDGRLEKAEVLVYRERRGREILARSFLRQFEGVSLTSPQQLDRRIDGITGATLSVNAMKNMARLALYLDRNLPAAVPPS